MPKMIPSTVWLDYIDLRTNRGFTKAEAARMVDISYASAQVFESGSGKSTGHHLFHLLQAGGTESGDLANGPIPYENLSADAKRGLVDFKFFRARYTGLTNSPWMEEANDVLDSMWRKSEDRRYVVMNMPPESGKTQFVHDKMAQLTAKDRSIKGLIGSFANGMAWNMMTQLGNTLIRQVPWQATTNDQLAGALDAEATMWQDYGRFKPEDSRRWNRAELLVVQEGGQLVAGKEATWTSYGRESGLNLGARYDYILWDDLVTMKSMGSVDTREKLLHWWDTEGETRLNMGGLLILLGQRISSTDLYKHALDKMGFEEGEDIDLAPTGRKFIHLCYQAHAEDECKGEDAHQKGAEPWRPNGEGGCILEPRRVGWLHQMTVKLNNPEHYATQFQQKDGDPQSVLIPSVWLSGGRDEDNVLYPGCWDQDRDFWELPQGLSRPIGIITVDPSPTKYWGVQAWTVVPDVTAVKRDDGTSGGIRYLVGMRNHKMDAPGFLEYHPATRVYTGLLNEWEENFRHMGVKLNYVIFEEAAAQRWALQYEIIKIWYRNHNVKVIGHKTHGWNKPDPVLGLPMLKPAYRDGRVRLPRKAYASLKDLVFQLTSYNQTYRGATDQIMANWFLESNLPTIVRRAPEEGPVPNPVSRLLTRINVKELMAR